MLGVFLCKNGKKCAKLVPYNAPKLAHTYNITHYLACGGCVGGFSLRFSVVAQQQTGGAVNRAC